ncbi:uncharacterized protein DUF2500 [Alkalibaculum bacchi]|jgi:hypothetical protein|uniref:Uncharacterized protein DUF2500 n=1 Tax=Alkalibaculum bacchi TaxID=645887 RepID=A0A366ICE0_9FIRM|nr:DUF2500 domain-containing protein [Alkalibaculum bacchi]RBP66735.1 uncharacterized protein DUF2500 [Alkalibaculum bacchi]
MFIDSIFFGGGFEIIFSIMFILVFCVIGVTLIKSILQWNKNNHSPRLTIAATVVAKRTNVSHHHHNTGDMGSFHSSSSTSYYVTFQIESGDRMELKVDGFEYGKLAEGDKGRLSFQGTRYLGFERRQFTPS